MLVSRKTDKTVEPKKILILSIIFIYSYYLLPGKTAKTIHMKRDVFVNRIKKSDNQSDFGYWQTQPYEKRLETLEIIRQEYIGWKYASKPRFQRIFRIVKRK